MPKTRPRYIALAAGALAVVILAVTSYLLLADRQERDVAVPADDATPEEVVTAYVDALDARDCATAEALRTPMTRESAAHWCTAVASLTNVVIKDHDVEDPAWSGRPPDQHVVGVPVSFDLDWRPFRSDVSMEEGQTFWGYILVRDHDSEPWRIADEGVG